MLVLEGKIAEADFLAQLLHLEQQPFSARIPTTQPVTWMFIKGLVAISKTRSAHIYLLLATDKLKHLPLKQQRLFQEK